ncbi:hypothetical protein [Streptomyces sp. URMC 123]|uniref:hypothetical protein n=1 Tax=Streptomyces sp. URMC 123 TaxID=3423403 RepID=UPI003F1A8361
MARRLLPSVLDPGPPIARGREFVRVAADGAADVLHPLIVVSRGLARLLGAGRRRWTATPQERRGTALFLAATCVVGVALVPYGPLVALVSVMAAAAWAGRDRTGFGRGVAGLDEERLQALYEGLVPYFSSPLDPAPLYAPGGDWQAALLDYEFDDSGRPARLVLRYPPYFTDGEPEARARVEQLLAAKCGRGREYLFLWDEESNQLEMVVLEALPADIRAQRFVTAPGETVLGFTDPEAVRRTLPVVVGPYAPARLDDGRGHDVRDVPPVVWRTGPRSTEPHLLALGHGGSGTTTLLRSIALQALQDGEVLVIDGSGTAEYAFLTGRPGVLAVESGLSGALAALEWASHETERRLIATHRARQVGQGAPDDVRRPMWIVVDRPSVLGQLAAAEERADPQELLRVPLRHGRSVHVTVVVAEQFDGAEALSETVRAHTRARVVLGAATPAQIRAVLGAPPHTTPPPEVPPGRGYARLGDGPVLRLQVPATPDPYDDGTSEPERQAVLGLLAQRQDGSGRGRPDEPGGWDEPEGPERPERTATRVPYDL